MKLFLPARHGLGNVIETYFTNVHGRNFLANIASLHREGAVSDVIAFYEPHMNPEAIVPLLENLPFPVKAHSTADYKGIEKTGHFNHFPDVVNGYTNAFRMSPNLLKKNVPEVPFPTRRPSQELPQEYIVLMPFAGDKERYLNDQNIVNTIKDTTNLPIVIIGKQIKRNGKVKSNIHGDIDLVNKLSILETAYVIEHSKFTVSALTFVRTFGFIFNKQILELYQGNNASTLKRTHDEYRQNFYGMFPEFNNWYKWPSERQKFMDKMMNIT